MKTLTKAEEGIMQVLWKMEKGFLGEIIHEMPSPKPHQNTVATILKILVEKQFVGIETFGRLNRYYPLIKKEIYSKGRVKSLVKTYYEGSFSNIVSSMVRENNLSIEELEMLVKQLKKGK
jgi:BlaI family transcriptional regulator, penicillinase repressor